MVRRFGNVVYWAALLVLGLNLLSTIISVNTKDFTQSAWTTVLLAVVIAAARYVLRGRL